MIQANRKVVAVAPRQHELRMPPAHALQHPSTHGATSVNNFWADIGGVQSRADPKVYVVQTPTTLIQRCMLMCTDPGDLVLDPTCGSGTTAYVAEQWGRR